MTASRPAPRRHELNQGFEWIDHAGPFRVVNHEQARRYDELGFFVLEDAVDPETLAAVTAAIDPFEADQEEALRAMEGGRFFIARADEITFTTHLVVRSPLLRNFTTASLFADLCADLVGPDVRLYWDQAVYKKPEKPRRFPWHQDTGYTYVEPQHYLTLWIALTDTGVRNGCPWILAGGHRAGTLLHHWVDPIGWECLSADPDDAVAAELPAGGAVVFSSLTPHYTGPNLTDSVRKAYIVQYAPVGIRRIEGDWMNGAPPSGSAPCDDPDRQFPVLRGGSPV